MNGKAVAIIANRNLLRIMKSWISLLGILILTLGEGFAQRQTATWLFGQNAGLHFHANGSINNFSGSAMDTPQGSASISDSQGNLLFYSDGETVWNRQHQVMANGSGLIGDKTIKQPCIIIPKPGSSSRYYLITHRPAPITPQYADGLVYHEIDMAAQNGLGEVVANAKNVVFYNTANRLYDYVSEKLTAVHHANNQDFWLIAHHYFDVNTHEFLSFKITSTGIVNSPIISKTPKCSVGIRDDKGGMKVSPNGKFLALKYFSCWDVYPFNNQTGSVSNNTVFDFNGGDPESCIMEFSPDGNKLYITSSAILNVGSSIGQFDLNAGNLTAIYNSFTYIKRDYTSFNYYSGIQLGPDGKIYITRNNSDSIYVINEPDKAGLACNFSSGPVLAAGSKGRFGFPNFIQSYFAPPRFTFTQSCAGSPVTFTIPDTSGMKVAKWNFGDAASGSLNQSNAFAPSHSFSAAGNYTVSLTLFFDGDSGVFTRQVTIPEQPKVNLGNDTIICKGSNFILSNRSNNGAFSKKYRWSTGDTTAAITVILPGKYWLNIQDSLCPASDTITVAFEPCPPPFFPNVITHNNDGKNETFQPLYLPKGIWQLKIYNRWGKEVYHSQNYQGDWNGKNVSNGTYYYLLQTNDGKRYKGWLEVMR